MVAKDDRKLRIEVGYGLEGALNDVTAKRIIDEVITPKFRSGDFAGGISAGVDRIIGVIDGEPLPAPAAAPSQQREFCLGRTISIRDLLICSASSSWAASCAPLLGRLIGAAATGGMVGCGGVVHGRLAGGVPLRGDHRVRHCAVHRLDVASGPRGSGGWSGGGVFRRRRLER